MKKNVIALILGLGFCMGANAAEDFSLYSQYDIPWRYFVSGSDVNTFESAFGEYEGKFWDLYFKQYYVSERNVLHVSYMDLAQACYSGMLHMMVGINNKELEASKPVAYDVCSEMADVVFTNLTNMSEEELKEVRIATVKNEEYEEKYANLFKMRCRAWMPRIPDSFYIYKNEKFTCDAKTDRCLMQTMYANSSGELVTQTLCCAVINQLQTVQIDEGTTYSEGNFVVRDTGAYAFFGDEMSLSLTDYDNDCKLIQ